MFLYTNQKNVAKKGFHSFTYICYKKIIYAGENLQLKMLHFI